MSDPDAAVVNHVGLCVADLDRSRRFYVEVLGFTVDRELTVPDEAASFLLSVDAPVNLTAVYLERGPFVLELLHFGRAGNPDASDRPFTQPGLTHLSFSVSDLEESVGRVARHGGEVVTVIANAAAIVRDPDGQLLELLAMTHRRTIPRDT